MECAVNPSVGTFLLMFSHVVGFGMTLTILSYQ